MGGATRPLLALRARPDPVSRFRDSVRVVQRPPFSHCVLGRTPAAGRRNPRRGFVIKRFLGCCCSRSWRCWSWAARSEPKPKNEQRKSHPLGGASSRRGGPTERSEKGARCVAQTSSQICEPKSRHLKTQVTCDKKPNASYLHLQKHPEVHDLQQEKTCRHKPPPLILS